MGNGMANLVYPKSIWIKCHTLTIIKEIHDTGNQFRYPQQSVID